MDERAVRRGVLYLALTGVLWGSIGLTGRLLQDRGQPAVTISFWRFACASVLLAPLLGRARLRTLAREARRPARLVAVSVGFLTAQVVYFLAVRDVGVAIATLVALGLAPVILTCSDAVAARARPASSTLASLASALLGLALVTVSGAPSPQAAPHPVAGIAEAVGTGLVYAVTTQWSVPLSRRLAPTTVTFATSVVGTLVLLPVVAVLGWYVPRSAPTVAGILWLAVVTTVIAYGLFYAGLRSTPGSIAMILTLLEPVTAVVLAAVLLGEPLTVTGVLGGILLLGAVLLLYLAPGRPPAPPPMTSRA